MLDRRGFIAGACCLACGDPAAARPAHRSFLCSTPDVANRSVAHIVKGHPNEAVVSPGIFEAVPDPGKIWRAYDGATPNTGMITLDVAFLNGTTTAHDLVARVAPDWLQGRLGRRIAFRFGRPVRSAHLRVGFHAGSGNWSDIGRDALGKTSPAAATMNLEDVTERSVRHEFGHALGLHHEHQHPMAGIRWNKAAVYAYTASVGWSRAKTDDNIFGHLSKDCVCKGDTKPDPTSVMVYPIPPDWTYGTFTAGLNTQISARDHRCLEQEYGA